LARAEGRLTGTSDGAQRLPERRKMMQAWADYLDELREQARKRTQGTRNPQPKPMHSSAAGALPR